MVLIGKGLFTGMNRLLAANTDKLLQDTLQGFFIVFISQTQEAK